MSWRISLNDLIQERLSKELINAIDDLDLNEETEPGQFVNLRNLLADLYPDPASARRIAEDTGVKTSRICFQTSPLNFWHGILKEICYAELYEDLKAVVLDEYPTNKKLRHAFEYFRCHPP